MFAMKSPATENTGSDSIESWRYGFKSVKQQLYMNCPFSCYFENSNFFRKVFSKCFSVTLAFHVQSPTFRSSDCDPLESAAMYVKQLSQHL